MNYKQRGVYAVAILMISAVLISSCTQSLSQASASTPTIIPSDIFVEPLASVENPMNMIQEFAQQTATAAAASGTPVTGTVITPQTGGTATPTATAPAPVCTPPPACPAGQVLTCVSGNCPGGCGVSCVNFTATPPRVTPTSPSGQTYILQKDEFPYCIARRFAVNPADLLQASGLTSPDIYYEGQKLIIPQNSPWPASLGPIELRPHPDTYTVTGNGDTSVNGVACKYGNADPGAIAQANGIAVSATLSVGQQLKVP